MKTFLIFNLAAALAGGAYLSRPTMEDFKNYVVQSRTKGDGNFLSKSWDEARAKAFADGCTYKDRYLWSEIEKDGQTIYAGVFSRWWNKDVLPGGK